MMLHNASASHTRLLSARFQKNFPKTRNQEIDTNPNSKQPEVLMLMRSVPTV